MKKRAISITTPEISAIFFAIGFILMIFIITQLWSMHQWAYINYNDKLAGALMLQIMLLFIMLFFFLISVGFPNYQIIKNNLFLYIDRISNPDWIGWLDFNRNKKYSTQIVSIGSFGQTKGVMNNEKADVFNIADYTITLPNGNQALIVNDMLSTNINLNNAVGWNLIHKHFGVFGYKAYELAVHESKLLFDVEKKKPSRKEVDSIGEVRRE